MDKVTLTDLIYPAIVAILASILSYMATLKSSNVAKDKERNDQIRNLLDNLTIQFTKLTSVFDSLSSDIENLSYFSLTNIQKGLKIMDSLNTYVWSTYLFEDSKLRIQVIETVDNASSLINEINGLENYPLSELQKAEEKRSEINKEYRQLRADLLKEGIVFKGKNLEATYSKSRDSKGKDKDKLKTANDILNEYLGELRKADTHINDLTVRNEKRRPLLATRIVDQKTRIRDLVLGLERLKSEES